jgi:uncharacterized membrane protein
VILFRGGYTHSRSVLKAISWRTLGTLDTFAISWFLTGKVGLAGSIAALEFATNIVWYYLHERVWAAAPWGPAPAFRNSDGEGFRTVTASNTMDARFQTVRVGFNYHFN